MAASRVTPRLLLCPVGTTMNASFSALLACRKPKGRPTSTWQTGKMPPRSPSSFHCQGSEPDMKCTRAWCRQHCSPEPAPALKQQTCTSGAGHARGTISRPWSSVVHRSMSSAAAAELAPRVTAVPRYPSWCPQLLGMGLETGVAYRANC